MSKTTGSLTGPPFFFSPYFKGAFYFFGFFGALGLYVPFLSLHFREVGLSGRQIGWTAIIPPIVMVLVTLPISSTADHYQRRRLFLQLCLIGCAVVIFLGRIPATFGGILVWYVAFALFNIPSISLANGLVARMARRYDLTFGSMRLWGSIGFSLLSTGFGYAVDRLGLPMMFPAAAAVFALAWLASGFLEEPRRLNKSSEERVWGGKKEALRQAPFWAVWRETRLVELVAPWMLMMMGFGVTLVFEGIYIEDLGGARSLIGLTLGIVAISEIPSMLGAEKLIGRLGGAQTLMVGYGLIALSMVAYALAPALWMMPIFGAIRGVGFGIALPANTMLVDRRVPVEWAASAQSTIIIGMGVARTIILPASGWLYDAAGGRWTFLACALVVSAAIGVIQWSKKGWILRS